MTYDDRRILTDDRDADDPHELSVYQAPNGDWYVRILPSGHKITDACVRIATSGGASASSPGVTAAVRRLWEALDTHRAHGDQA